MTAPAKRFTFQDLRAWRDSGQKLAMLTCYDFSTARLMQEAGVPILLVGDTAAMVMLGYENTIRVPLSYQIEITAAVRRGRRFVWSWRICRSVVMEGRSAARSASETWCG